VGHHLLPFRGDGTRSDAGSHWLTPGRSRGSLADPV